MPILPHTLYTTAQVRELDRRAIEEYGIPGIELMERAGQGAFRLLQELWPEAARIVVVCGTGNNGGDGFVVARLAHEHRLPVRVVLVGEAQQIKGDALLALQAMRTAGLDVSTAGLDELSTCDLVVDALLGTGLNGEVRGQSRLAIEAINLCGKPVLSLDIPSGLSADTGVALGDAVIADATLTFIALKRGLFTGEAATYTGNVYLEDLLVPPQAYSNMPASAERLDYPSLSSVLMPRARTLHKGECGHVLIVGGVPGYCGAVRLTGEAALRTGAGLVSLAVHPGCVAGLIAGRPELMCHAVDDAAAITPLLRRAEVIAIGPGLAQEFWGSSLWQIVLTSEVPLVVDADALNLLAKEPHHRNDWVLTPHPGEAARLLGETVAVVQADRFHAAEEIQRRYGGVVVLKGYGTIICDETGIAVCDAGNPGMASAGMGDVLTGVIASLLAQGFTLGMATRLGVCLHGWAGDQAAVSGERGLLASDLITYLRVGMNPELQTYG